MKFLFELVLGTIIIFFVWNILKRIFFTSFYKYTGFKPFPKKEDRAEKKENSLEKKVQWDAETVDFEEVKEEPRKK